MELFDYKSCYAHSVGAYNSFICLFVNYSFLAKSRTTHVNIGVEVIVKSKQRSMTFDDCLNTFFRRILEEAHNAEIAAGSFCVGLRIIPSASATDTVHNIQVSSMKDQRQHVLALLKSAVVSEGDIVLDFYLSVDSEGFEKNDEINGSFIHVVRRYQLTFIDDLGRTRCFSRHPEEALAVDLFRSLRDAQLYFGSFQNHMKAIRSNSNNQNELDDGEQTETWRPENPSALWTTWTRNLLMSFVDLLSERTRKLIRDGDILSAAETMIELNAVLIHQDIESPTASSVTLEQLKVITLSEIVHLRTIRDNVESLMACQAVFLQSVELSSAVLNKEKGEDNNILVVRALHHFLEK